jgi:hypothetical protein
MRHVGRKHLHDHTPTQRFLLGEKNARHSSAADLPLYRILISQRGEQLLDEFGDRTLRG